MRHWIGWLGRSAPSPSFGTLRPAHAARLAEIHAGSFARPWAVVDFEQMLAERGVAGDAMFLGRAGPSGFVLSRQVEDEAEILTLALAPAARGRGHAGTLLRRHIAMLAASGVRELHLEVEDGNEAALALYRRHGFREVGRRPGYYRKPDGTPANALLMSRSL